MYDAFLLNKGISIQCEQDGKRQILRFVYIEMARRRYSRKRSGSRRASRRASRRGSRRGSRRKGAKVKKSMKCVVPSGASKCTIVCKFNRR